MQKMVKLLILSILLITLDLSINAQGAATADVSATITIPIAISKTLDLSFGNVAVSVSQGTVVLTPSGARSLTGGVVFPANEGIVAAASFIVTGASGFVYSVTLPTTTITIDDNAGHSMTVDNWTSTPTPIGTLNDGTSTLTIGATLYVGANQEVGIYTSDTPFNVTVNYN